MPFNPLNSGLFQFRDPSTDQPVRSGEARVTDAGTGEAAQVYGDAAGTVIFATGVVPLNSNGEAYIFGNGTYTIKVYDCCGALIQTFTPVSSGLSAAFANVIQFEYGGVDAAPANYTIVPQDSYGETHVYLDGDDTPDVTIAFDLTGVLIPGTVYRIINESINTEISINKDEADGDIIMKKIDGGISNIPPEGDTIGSNYADFMYMGEFDIASVATQIWSFVGDISEPA